MERASVFSSSTMKTVNRAIRGELLSGGYGQGDQHRRPLSTRTGNGQGAFVLLDESLGDGQTEAGSVRLRGEEGFKDMCAHVLGDPPSRVHDDHFDGGAPACWASLLTTARGDGEHASFGHRFHGVGDDLEQCQLDLEGIDPDLREIPGIIDPELDLLLRELLRESG